MNRLSRALVIVLGGLAATFVACSDSASTPPEGDGGPGPGPGSDGSAPTDAAPAVTCTAPTGAGTTHGSGNLEGDEEVWTAAASPHILTFSLSIRAGKKLTIEPCAVVRLRENISIDVTGTLVAEGTASTPIVFERAVADKAWTHIHVNGNATARLAYATLDGGGNPGNSALDNVSTLSLIADPNEVGPIHRTTRVDHVTVRGSSSLGVDVEGIAAFTEDSRDLTVTKSASAPIRTWLRSVGTIPTGSYGGNARDEVLLNGGSYGRSAVEGDVTIPARGLPYHVVWDLRVGRVATGADVPGVLAIEPGVTLRFDKNKVISMAGTSGTGNGERAIGSLSAVGTAEKPIVLTSSAAAPAPGDWGGLVFSGVPTSRSRVEYTTIAYAGGGNGIASASCGNGTGGFGDEAAITIVGWDAQPTSPFIRSSRFEHLPRYGIVSGWRGDPVDFLTSNTFVDVASCWVSYPRNAANSCPATPPCPGH